MKILFAADMSFNYFTTFPGKEKAYAAMAEAAGLFQQADFSMINLENILGDRTEGEPIVKSGPNLIAEDAFAEYVYALQPDIIGMANNHAKDFGESMMYHTMQMLGEAGYTCIGAGRNLEEAYQPAKVSKNGVKAAIIAVCENEFGVAGEQESGTAGYRLGMVTKAIKAALSEGAKPIIYFHGGNEHNPFPSPGKVELYRHFIDIGAEAVIAMHTHCPQGYEYYNDKPIVYSMGNFFFPKENKSKAWYHGYISELDISEDKTVLTIHPYRFDYDGIMILEGRDKEAFMQYIEALNQPIQDPQKLSAYFDSWCAVSGYTGRLAGLDQEIFADGHTQELKKIKNLLCCEAHNELLKNAMLLLFNAKKQTSEAGMDDIRKLQNMEGFV